MRNILNKEIHLPSLDQLWQIPETLAFPIPLLVFLRLLPLELQETSYFAESANKFNLSIISIKPPEQIFLTIV